MSRIGRMPITVPAGVTVEIADGNLVTVKGPKGTLQKQLHADMIIKQEGSELIVQRPSEDKAQKPAAQYGRRRYQRLFQGA